MPHPEYWPLIEARADEQLAPADATRLDAHLQECDECRRRLELARRENDALRLAFAAATPPPSLAGRVMAVTTQRARVRRHVAPAMVAGFVASLLSALLLIAFSLGTSGYILPILGVALIVAVLWGALKGWVFGLLVPRLTGNLMARGLLFGAGIWMGTNALLAASGGLFGGTEFASSFILLGSLVHDLIYGLLVSWIYAWLTSPGGPAGGRTAMQLVRGSGSSVLCLVLALQLCSSTVLATQEHGAARTRIALSVNDAASRAIDSPTATPTASETPSSTPTATVEVTATPAATQTATVSPTASVPARPVPTSAPASTTAVPAATSVARPSAPVHKTLSSRSPGDQLKQVLPSLVLPTSNHTPIDRVRHVLNLLNFL